MVDLNLSDDLAVLSESDNLEMSNIGDADEVHRQENVLSEGFDFAIT